MDETDNTGKLTHEEKNKAVDVTRMIARLPEEELAKIYYMLKGRDIFSNETLKALPRAAVF